MEEKRQPFVRLKKAVEFPEGQTELTGVQVIEVRTSLKNATELKSIRAGPATTSFEGLGSGATNGYVIHIL